MKNLSTIDINEDPRYCGNIDFKDNAHNHVITGNLDILEDPELVHIFKYGSKVGLAPRFMFTKLRMKLKIALMSMLIDFRIDFIYTLVICRNGRL